MNQPAAGGSGPSWPSTLIAISLIALVGGIFIAVFEKSGADDALKVWGGIGTLVGVLTGAIPTYFFQQGTVQATKTNLAAAQDAAATARADADNQRTRADTAQSQFSALAGAAAPELVDQVKASHPTLFGP